MSCEPPLRAGFGPVRRLDELPEAERRLVAHLRLWAAGRTGQDALRRVLEARGGPAAGRAAFDRLEELMCLLVVHGRRPLRIAPVGAAGALGDECVLARFVALAAEGAREDAVLIATLLVRADVALGLAGAAEALGLVLLRAPEAARPIPLSHPKGPRPCATS